MGADLQSAAIATMRSSQKNYLLITCIWVVSGIRTHINMLHRHVPKPLGHHYHILSGMGESDSRPQHGKLV